MYSGMPTDVQHFIARQRDESRTVVLFGSRAAGCAEQRSDWDILVFGPGQRQCGGRLDVVYVPVEGISSWLGSELATHVVAYGRWMDENQWLSPAQVDFGKASSGKREMLRRQVSAVDQAWRWLGRARRQRVARMIAHDIWRLYLLDEHIPVCATACLAASAAARHGAEIFGDYLKDLGVSRSRIHDVVSAMKI